MMAKVLLYGRLEIKSVFCKKKKKRSIFAEVVGLVVVFSNAR